MTDYFSYTLDAGHPRHQQHRAGSPRRRGIRAACAHLSRAHGKATGKGLHRATVELVRAPKQAELADAIFGELTDEEHDVFRRTQRQRPRSRTAPTARSTRRPRRSRRSSAGSIYRDGTSASTNCLTG